MILIFDTAIIGAGINGCATAHFLTKGGEKVALFDQAKIAAGGSGAAGAFVSPKISKGGPLKELMEEAYRFSLAYYARHFTGMAIFRPLLHLSKHLDENGKVAAFKETTALPRIPEDARCRALLQEGTEAYERVMLAQSGLVDAQGVCRAMASRARFIRERIESIQYEEGYWRIGQIRAKKVVLATGAYRHVVPMPHITLRAVWGHRIDIRTATPLPCHLHQYVSIAATDAQGCSAIGATHDLHYHPEHSTEPYDVEAGRRELLEKARRTLKLAAVEVLEDYTGLRSGSNDYMPMLGKVVDAEATLQQFPKLAIGEGYAPDQFAYHPGLYMINGVGGYGFVLGPWLAKRLSEQLLEGAALPERLDPTRFFVRWAKRS